MLGWGAFLPIFYTVELESAFNGIIHIFHVDLLATHSIEAFNVSSSVSKLKGLDIELNDFPIVISLESVLTILLLKTERHSIWQIPILLFLE